PGDAVSDAPSWKQVILGLARDHDDRLSRYEKRLDQMVSLPPGGEGGPANRPMPGIGGTIRRLIEQQRGAIAVDRRRWTGALKAIDDGAPADVADRFSSAVAELLVSQEANHEKYWAMRAELVEVVRVKADPPSTVRAERLIEDASEFLAAE